MSKRKKESKGDGDKTAGVSPDPTQDPTQSNQPDRPMMLKHQKIELELAQVVDKEDGLLRARDVVNAARNAEKFPTLHSQFEWDDNKAAEQHRLAQARKIIRIVIGYADILQVNQHITVNVFSQPKSMQAISVPVYISLTPDRREPGGGYRDFNSVMQDAELRGQSIADAIKYLDVFRVKYGVLLAAAGLYEQFLCMQEDLKKSAFSFGGGQPPPGSGGETEGNPARV